MISQREIQISNIINTYSGNDKSIIDFQNATLEFGELVRDGKAKHRGNQVASVVYLTDAQVDFGKR